jgi:hypothetical protein
LATQIVAVAIGERLTFQTEVRANSLGSSPSLSAQELRQRSAPLQLAEPGKERVRPNPHGITLASHHDDIVASSEGRIADPRLHTSRQLADAADAESVDRYGSDRRRSRRLR